MATGNVFLATQASHAHPARMKSQTLGALPGIEGIEMSAQMRATYDPASKHYKASGFSWDRPFRLIPISQAWNGENGTFKVEYQLHPDLFPFLKLPPEIRNQIFNLVIPPETDNNNAVCVSLIRNKSVKRCRDKNLAPPPRKHTPTSAVPWLESWIPEMINTAPSLLRVNKQINAEAASNLYHRRFLFNGAFCARTFLQQIGSKGEYVRHISVECINRRLLKDPHEMFLALKHAPNIEGLALQLSDAFKPYYLASPMEWFTKGGQELPAGVTEWLREMGRRHGRKTAGIDMLQLWRSELASNEAIQGTKELESRMKRQMSLVFLAQEGKGVRESSDRGRKQRRRQP